jgi:hypothetical protein
MMKGAEMDEHHPREGEENRAGATALRDRIAGLMGQALFFQHYATAAAGLHPPAGP